MNARKPIQPLTDPVVLSVSFSNSRRRFAASLSDGARVFRTDNCLTTYTTALSDSTGHEPAISIFEILDDRYVACVPRKDAATGTGNVVIFRDCIVNQEICRYDFHERILGVRLSRRFMAVILEDRTAVFAFNELKGPDQTTTPFENQLNEPHAVRRGPSKVHGLVQTASNPFALASLADNVLVLPAQSTGQVQLIPLGDGNKRIIRAHNSPLQGIALSQDGTLLATASAQGTLVRVFDTRTTDQIAEFRRGMEKAVIHSLAFSPRNRWLASTSDKGTLHVFDLRPRPDNDPNQLTDYPQQGSSRSRPASHAAHRLSGGVDKESMSAFSGRSSPASATAASAALSPSGTPHAGSVQEYYGLRPVPRATAAATGRETAASALSALKASGWAPKALKDARSVASAAFWTGEDGPLWQSGVAGGGSAYKWTTAPNGTRVRVKRPVPPLADDPTGRPPKGILAFAPVEGVGPDAEDQGASIYVIGGGVEGRWEMFDLVPMPMTPGGGGSGWALAKRGFRRFMSRQFVD